MILLALPSLASTLRVGAAEPYPTLADALAAAVDGDTLVVVPGTYPEAIDPTGRSLTIVSEDGASATFLTPPTGVDAITVAGGEMLVLEGFTLRPEGARAVVVTGSTFSGTDLTVSAAGSLALPGGGVSADSADVTLRNSTFTGSVASEGGHLYATNGSVIDGEDLTLSDGEATSGGAVYADGGSSVALNVVDVTTSAATFGGAFGLDGATLTLTDVDVSGASAEVGGGAWVSGTAGVSCTRCAWADVVATGDAGGISLAGASTWTDVGGSFLSATAGGSGGAFFLDEGASATFSEPVFEGCRAVVDGGAIYAGTSTTLTIEGGRVEGNDAGTEGGGIAASAALSTTFRDLDLLRNTAGGGGGGVYAATVEVFSFSRGLVHGNQALEGGGIALLDGVISADLTNVVATDNLAADGGGLWLSGSLQVAVTNATFAGNTASTDGGHLYTAGPVALVNDLFIEAGGGGGMWGATDSGSDRSYNLAWDNTGGDWLVWSDPTGSGGNIAEDPLLVAYTADTDETNDDLTLAFGSPAQDGGSPSLVDVDGTVSDIGVYGGPDAAVVDGDADGVFPTADCDDGDGTIFFGATEVAYDGIDQDCDGADLDDVDIDGQAAQAVGGDDCDDADGTIFLGATEVAYDGIDQDCDGADLDDVDVDGQAAQAVGGDDCDDGDGTIFLGATEVAYDGIDQDCDGADLDDVDLDGQAAEAVGGDDCDDAEGTIFLGASEIAYDGVDQDCDGADLDDVDLDGQVAAALGGDDCDDADDTVFLGATEVAYDGIDQDCDGADLDDVDLDGHVATEVGGDDCDDTNAAILPGAAEIMYDGVDQDCDGASDFDADADGYDSDIWGGDDCDDEDPTLSPGATEVPYDGVDQDCDDGDLVDVDGDGWSSEAGGGADCDDSDATVYPGAAEDADDGLDTDCDGTYEDDIDGDGYVAEIAGGTDCDDLDADVHPDGTEVWYDGVDQDCDGADDDQDADGYLLADDCDDLDAEVYPGADERVNGIDDDCDGYAEDGDRDGDGISDDEEALIGTDPAEADTDGDALSDGEEYTAGPDQDGDGLVDPLDTDDDGDGIGTLIELSTDLDGDGAFDQDVDGDQLINAWDLDSDDDGYSDAKEGVVDADHDELPDYLDFTGGFGGGGCFGGQWAGLVVLGAFLRRRRVAALGGALIAPSAWALDAHNFDPGESTGDPAGYTRVGSASVAPAGSWDVGVTLDYADSPLVEVLPEGRVPVVEEVAAVNVAAAVSVGRVQIEGQMPAVLVGTDASGGFVAAGDVRLGARVGLLNKESLPKVALEIGGWVPTGSEEHYASAGPRGMIALLAGHDFGQLGLIVSAGAMAGAPESLRDVTTGLGPVGGLGVAWRYSPLTSTVLEVSTRSNVGLVTLPLEATLSQRIRTRDGLFVTVGGAAGLTGGVGASRWRAFLGVGYSRRPPAVEPAPPRVARDPALDTDGDGISDAVDDCFDQPETRDGFTDADGCPELDGDGDGVAFFNDACPSEPIRIGQVAAYSDGCPKLAEFAGDHIAVTQDVLFVDNRPDLQPGGERVLEAVREVMLDHPNVALFLVEGIPARGSPTAYDLRLSDARAFIVMNWLAQHEVPVGRLISRVNSSLPPPAVKGRGLQFRVVHLVDVPPDARLLPPSPHAPEVAPGPPSPGTTPLPDPPPVGTPDPPGGGPI